MPLSSTKNCIFASYLKKTKIMRIKLISVVILFVLLLGACSAPKDVYLQGVDTLTPEQISQMNQTYTSRISKDDLLAISVTAPDPSVTTPFNPPVFAYAQQGDQPIAASQSMYTYLVDSDGNINFPVLGKIHVAGLSKQELCDELQSKLSKYIENPLVNVQITNYRITVMGEVNRPGTFTIKNDRISILDAFGYVGDLAITANRKNILLIRDNDGQKEFVRMDITDPSLFTSPYFYLRQNDVIYVEPNLAKQRNSRFSQSKQYNITVFSSIISAISVISSMVITIINIKK